MPAAFQPNPSATSQQPARPAETAAGLIDRAVRAKGGIEKLRSIRTVKAVATVRLSSDEGRPIDIATTTSIRYPGAFRIDAQMPAGPLVQVFNSGEYWVQDGRGIRVAPEKVAAEMNIRAAQLDAIDEKGANWLEEFAVNFATAPAIRERVSRGEVVGYVGSTGYSTGCHLHFMVYRNGGTVDPMGYL